MKNQRTFLGMFCLSEASAVNLKAKDETMRCDACRSLQIYKIRVYKIR